MNGLCGYIFRGYRNEHTLVDTNDLTVIYSHRNYVRYLRQYCSQIRRDGAAICIYDRRCDRF